jgi:outer membrane protein TolC
MTTNVRNVAPRAIAAVAVALCSVPALAQQRSAPGQQQGGAPKLPPPPPEPQRRVVSLREALQLTAKQSPDVAAARAQAAVTGVGVERAWNAWKPDLSATGTFDHTSAPSSFDATEFVNVVGRAYKLGSAPAYAPVDPTAIPPPITLVAPNSRYGTLQLSQPIFSPQGLFLPGVAYAARDSANQAADQAREQILLETARTYLGLQGLQGLLAAARDAEQVALRREQDARARIEAGTDVEIALLRAQTDTANARANIATLGGQIESFFPLLNALTGEAIAPEPLSPSGASSLGNPGDAASEPWERTYAVQSAVSAVRSVERAVRLDNFLWLPSAAAVAKGNYNSNGGFAGTSTSYDLILNITVPLYDHGVRYAQLHEDQARLQQAMANLASARARGRAAWEASAANLVAAIANLEQANAQAALATRTQEQVEASYRAGVATSLDVTDADNRKFQAQSAAAQARANVEVRRAEVAAAEGRLFTDAMR